MSNLESPWKTLLLQWPDEMPRRGIVISTQGEQIPFNGFMTSEHFVVFSRNTPDALGARTVILPYDNLATVKMTEIVKSPVYQKAGFQGELGRQ